jgi:hypothetical protein
MSIEALWALRFQLRDKGQGGGVIVFESGRLFGGDSSYVYTGHYTVSAGHIEATATVVQHTDVDGMADIWETGEKSFQVAVTGRFSGDDVIQAKLARDGGGSIKAALVRVAALPG